MLSDDELRAMADALEPMAKAPRFEDFDVPAFCAYLRACADAKPVAWRFEVRGMIRGEMADWRHYNTTTSLAQALASVERCGNGIEGRAVPLYAHPAPQPQPEPMPKGKPGFVQQIENSRENVKAWPQWMQDATVESAATMPKFPTPQPESTDYLRNLVGATSHCEASDQTNVGIGRLRALLAEIDRLTRERDELSDEVALKSACINGMRQATDKLAGERDEARAERDALANVLPGHYYMDPPDGGDVPVLEQLRRMSRDAARYRFLACKGVPPHSLRCSRWRLEYWNGEWWNPLMKEELDAAIDAQIEQERSEQAKEG